ncbi:MAG: hypothetical protein AABX75_00775 [Nanoarchaeota archaeon]
MAERVMILGLRKRFLIAPMWRRSKKAMNIITQQVLKHTKADEVKISKWLNEHIWAHGGKNPPGKVKIRVDVVTEKDRKIAKVELFELPTWAKREAEAAKLKESKKKKTESAKAAKEEKAKKEEEFKKKKEEEQKKLAEAKEHAKPTKEQEMAMNKK